MRKIGIGYDSQEKIYQLACGWLDSDEGSDLGLLTSWKELYNVLSDNKGETNGELERAVVEVFGIPAIAEKGIYVKIEGKDMYITNIIEALDLDEEDAASVMDGVQAFYSWIDNIKASAK